MVGICGKSVLVEALKRAQKAGFNPDKFGMFCGLDNVTLDYLATYFNMGVNKNLLLYDHEFAKYLFGVKDYLKNLQEMVIARNPLYYLDKWLKDNS